MNTRRLQAAVLTLVLAAAPTALMAATQQTDTSAKQDMKNAGSNTKDAAKDAGSGIKKGTKKVAHGTKKAAIKTGTGTRNVGRRIEGKEPVPNNPQ